MSFDKMILWVMAIGVLVGAIDKILGNRLGLGEQFDEGFNAMGPLALGMVGIVCLAPVISKYLGPIIIPVFTAVGADPALFGSILANDMEDILSPWNWQSTNKPVCLPVLSSPRC